MSFLRAAISPLANCVIPTEAAQPRSGGICFSSQDASPVQLTSAKERP
jgi:hypothetical protein